MIHFLRWEHIKNWCLEMAFMLILCGDKCKTRISLPVDGAGHLSKWTSTPFSLHILVHQIDVEFNWFCHWSYFENLLHPLKWLQKFWKEFELNVVFTERSMPTLITKKNIFKRLETKYYISHTFSLFSRNIFDIWRLILYTFTILKEW